MSEVSPRQRQGLILLLSVGIVAGSSVLAWHYRPLSPTERQLLGHWCDEGVFDVEGFTFTEDRRFVREEIAARWIAGEGSWSASGGKLQLVYDRQPPPWALSWVAAAARLQHLLRSNRYALDVEFEGATRMNWLASDSDERAGSSRRKLVGSEDWRSKRQRRAPQQNRSENRE